MQDKNFNFILDNLKDLNTDQLTDLLRQVGKKLGVSEHVRWCFHTLINKYHTEDYLALAEGAVPYEVYEDGGNIILNGGAAELLKALVGASATPYSEANAYMAVGSSETPSAADQVGVLASLGTAKVQSGYPQVSGRSVIFRAVFDDDAANGNWREVCILNGNTGEAVALNRTVQNMGTKALGSTWTLQGTITILSA